MIARVGGEIRFGDDQAFRVDAGHEIIQQLLTLGLLQLQIRFGQARDVEPVLQWWFGTGDGRMLLHVLDGQQQKRKLCGVLAGWGLGDEEGGRVSEEWAGR